MLRKCPLPEPIQGPKHHCHQQDKETAANHAIKRCVYYSNIRPIIAWNLIQSFDDRVKVVIGQKTQTTRDLNSIFNLAGIRINKPKDLKGHTSLCLNDPLHRGKLDGLIIGQETSIEVSTNELQRSGHDRHEHTQQYSLAHILATVTP